MTKFNDIFQDDSGSNYVGKEEKAVLVSGNVPFPVTKVTKGESRFGPKYNVHTLLDGEERVISFGAGSVESRDRMLDALQDYLLSDDAEPTEVYMEQVKQSILLRVVSDDE
jgi:hypothetical protein